MVSTMGIISLVVSLAVALGVIFVINSVVLKRPFDATTALISIIVVAIALTIGAMVSSRIVGRKSVEAPKVKITG